MAMLAEAKSKQKWSEDPRNIKWSSDKERYGYQMLEKMGWADGKGLGKDKSGSTSHVKIKKRKHNLGLGAKECHDNDWIAQQADFNNLLSALQQHGGNAELRSEEQNKKAMLEVAKASRKRVFYKRFIRSKDTSQYSQKDMDCIFGNSPSQSAPVTPLNQSDDEVTSEDSAASCPTVPCNSTSGFVTYTSKQNIQEYFACRMKELQDGKGIERSNEGDKGVNGEKPGDVERGDGMDNQGGKGIYLDTEGDGKSKGKKRGNLENRPEIDSRKIKKRKKSKLDPEQDMMREEKCVSGNHKESLGAEGSQVMKTKKSKKVKKDIDSSKTLGNTTKKVNEQNEKEISNEEVPSKVKTKKSKKRRRKDDSEMMANGMESVTEEIEKSLCDEDASSFRGADKVKAKKSRKRRTKDDMRDAKDDMRDAKDDMGDAKDDMRDAKDDMRDAKDDMRNGKDDMRDGKDDMRDAKDDMRDARDDMRDTKAVFCKQDKVKRKKSKKKTKHEKKDE